MSNTIKLIVMIAQDDLDRIDDWRYEHRAASRSEAVRRLLARALTDDVAPGVPATPAEFEARSWKSGPGPWPDSLEAPKAAREYEIAARERVLEKHARLLDEAEAKGLQAGGVEE